MKWSLFVVFLIAGSSLAGDITQVGVEDNINMNVELSTYQKPDAPEFLCTLKEPGVLEVEVSNAEPTCEAMWDVLKNVKGYAGAMVCYEALCGPIRAHWK